MNTKSSKNASPPSLLVIMLEEEKVEFMPPDLEARLRQMRLGSAGTGILELELSEIAEQVESSTVLPKC